MDQYRALFERYVEDLELSRQRALAWWDGLVAAERAHGLDDSAARQAVEARWPCGPTSHPQVLEVYRRYFLECEQLNREHISPAIEPPAMTEDDWGADSPEDETEKPAGPVPPNVFAVDWLAGKQPQLQALLAALLLAPIGLADDGTFC